MNEDRLIKIFSFFQSKFHFEREQKINYLSKKLLTKDNIESIHYYLKIHGIYPETILIVSLFFAIMSFFLINILTFVFNNIIFLILSIFTSYLLMNKVSNYFLTFYNYEKLIILSHTDFIFQEFLLVLNTNKSIFDAIKFISDGEYPFVSKEFKKMILNINHGVKPELSLLKYAENQPCESFKSRMSNLIHSKFDRNYIIKELEKDSSEIDLEYEKSNKELESKLILIIGFAIFIPILISMLFSFYSLSSNYLIIIFFPIYYLVSRFIEKKTFPKGMMLFGDFTQEAMIQETEFNDLLDFFILFCNQLRETLSPERSLILAFMDYEGVLHKKFKKTLNYLLMHNFSLINFFEELKIIVKNNQSKRFIDLISRMVLFDSNKASERILYVISRIKQNQNLITKRKLIFASHKFKIHILCIILNGILGLISSISPLISISSANIFSQDLAYSSQMQPLFNFFPIFILLGTISAYSTFFILSIFQIKQKEIKTVIFFLIFIFILLISLQFLNYSI